MRAFGVNDAIDGRGNEKTCAVRFRADKKARGGRRGPYEGQNVVRNPAITLLPPCGAKPRTTDVE